MNAEIENKYIGLCAHCQHVKVIQNRNQSTFYMCLLAQKNTLFQKYPALPVFECRGYIKKQDFSK